MSDAFEGVATSEELGLTDADFASNDFQDALAANDAEEVLARQDDAGAHQQGGVPPRRLRDAGTVREPTRRGVLRLAGVTRYGGTGQRDGPTADWWNGNTAECRNGGMAEWRIIIITERWTDGMAERRYNGTNGISEWRNERMTQWRNVGKNGMVER